MLQLGVEYKSAGFSFQKLTVELYLNKKKKILSLNFYTEEGPYLFLIVLMVQTGI